MDFCDDCLNLANRLQLASEHYVNLSVQQDRIIQDGNARAGAFEHVMQEAQSRVISAAQELLAHRGTHEGLSRPKTRTAGL